MRVISGSAKGLQLKAPPTNKVRPAADKVKGAIFNILGDISGAQVLDLFAGSGSVGIEALSRGAAHCTLVEADKQIAAFIEKNLVHCKLQDQAQLLIQKVEKALPWLEKKGKSFHLIFVDPPYDKNLLNPTLKLLTNSPLLHPHTLIICEHSPRELPNFPKQAIAVEGEALRLGGPTDGAMTEGNPLETRAPLITHSPREIPTEETLEITDSRKYGQTLISFLKLTPSPQSSPSRGEGV